MPDRPWFVRSVRACDTHRAASEHWTRDDRINVRPDCDPSTTFTALNRTPIALPYYDEQRCPACLTIARPARQRLSAVVR
ncbi:hypothetical protein [Actinoalloteichus hymeniacidonis]|uniref:Uncharacterized protein n=1 Tax=Actinoalloteichus hymeniacidonis TaxID=340345 RepID=A0AAC9HTQ8_9PSEU|nr:hypothetical protein [Actinoalloteichus hymeniacidonis]AOS65517.1 hypothetical protein TL08_23685 [Actinoalloteichus hymeniacidonis]MBB5906396.1 hypothetical protein [Actinoalloteichus hymeniacidonis]